MKSKAGPLPCNTLPTSPVTLEPRSPWLLGRCSRQLRKSCAGSGMVQSRVERVFTLEQHFASGSFDVVPECMCFCLSGSFLPPLFPLVSGVACCWPAEDGQLIPSLILCFDIEATASGQHGAGQTASALTRLGRWAGLSKFCVARVF
jgi:hypothetical protein